MSSLLLLDKVIAQFMIILFVQYQDEEQYQFYLLTTNYFIRISNLFRRLVIDCCLRTFLLPLLYSLLLLMSFYQLGKSHHLKVLLTPVRLVFSENYLIQDKCESVLLFFEDGSFQAIDNGNRQLRGSGTLAFNEKRIKHILKAKTCQNVMVVQNFKQMFLVDISALLDLAFANINLNFNVKIISVSQKRDDWLSTMTNIHFKLINQEGKVCLKVVGRQKQQLAYSFYELNTATAALTLIEQQKHTFHNQYKVSLQSQDKDIIIYQSTVNKFKPIKVALLSYFSHQSSRDTSMLQHHEVMQFQQQCYVSNIFKLSKDILCIVIGSHLQADCQSNIILFDCHLKQTINNITIKDVMIIESYIFCNRNARLAVNSTDVSLDWFARQGGKHYTIQVLPFCFLPHCPKEIPASDSHFSCTNSLILHNQSTSQLAILPKISKKAIYLSWLCAHFSHYSSLFGSVLALLD